MVQRIESTLKAMGLLIVAIASTAAVALDHALARQLKDWSAYVAVGIIAASAVLFEHLVGLMIRKWQFIRKTISGEDYIEGTWIEAYPAQNPRENHVAIITIRFHERESRLSGITFSASDLGERGHWRSLLSSYDAGSLLYLYEENVAGKSVLGSGQLFFKTVQGYPVRYHSQIFDPIHTSKLIGFGRKVENKSDLRIIKEGGLDLRSVLDRYRKG